jgi:hypothetical protein
MLLAQRRLGADAPEDELGGGIKAKADEASMTAFQIEADHEERDEARPAGRLGVMCSEHIRAEACRFLNTALNAALISSCSITRRSARSSTS